MCVGMFIFLLIYFYLFITADHVWQASPNRTHHGVKRVGVVDIHIYQRLLIILMMTYNESKIKYRIQKKK
jgi:hypothetical protein